MAAIAWSFLGSPAQVEPMPIDRATLERPNAPSTGRPDAPVVIVEFLDPACGTCRMFYPMVKELMAQYPGRVRLVVRYAPFHQGSDKVVAALEASRKQGKFWETLEALLDSQEDWASNHTAKVGQIWKHLDKLGLNLEQMVFDMTAPEVQQAIDQDMKDANAMGVAQTPEYFVNGRPLPSFGFDQLQQLVAEEVAKTR
jgi:protein-disulfide isomerase